MPESVTDRPTKAHEYIFLFSKSERYYYDADANTHEVNAALPWSTTISTTLPAVSANIMVQGDSDHIGCRITVDGTVRDEKSTNGVNAQTFCLVKSA